MKLLTSLSDFIDVPVYPADRLPSNISSGARVLDLRKLTLALCTHPDFDYSDFIHYTTDS